MTLNRRDLILKYIVEHFIKTAQPVGSKTLIDEYGLNYSSATIRNEMNALEQMGLLEKTHSSSGRVPSSEGYRFYCQYLRETEVDETLRYTLQTVFEEKSKSVETVIEESCQILSHMTSLASVVLGPDANEEKLASIHFVPLSDKSATVVFVTDQGYCENKTFVLTKDMNMEDLKKCMKLLNDRLVGTKLSNLVEKTEALRPLLTDLVIDHDVLYKAMLQAFIKFASDRLKLYGKDELFANPEFANDADKLKKIISMLENPETITEAEERSDRDFQSGDISIHIGSQVDGEPDVSIITTKIKLGDEDGGTLALVGPTRMDYAKVLSSLQYFIDELQKYFKGGK